MFLILLSWIYILFTTLNLGCFLDKILGLKVKNFAVISILGLFLTTIITSFWAIIGRINFEFHIAILLLNITLFLSNKIAILSIYRNFYNEIKNLEKSLKIFLEIITFFIIAQCASVPYAIDNESYYIQSIKWINEFGFVKGLANIHFFLGQTSGWHVTQSAFNFSFLYDKFNDLSGFCLLLGNIFAIQKLNDYFKNHDKTKLIIGLFPLANVFLFQFISAPSPDIPIYVFTFIIFAYFLENYGKINNETFNLISILVLFCMYIKTTAIGLCLLPLIMIFQNFKQLKIYKITFLSVLILGLFVAKNMIVTGYALFPMTNNFGFVSDYQIPEKIAVLYYTLTKYFAYSLTEEQFNQMTAWEVFLRWFSMPKLHGIFNKISLFLIIFTPIILYKFFNQRKFWILYFIMSVQLLLLFLSSPQYRFFMNFILFFTFLWMAIVMTKRKQILILLGFSTFATAFVLFVPLNLKSLARNEHAVATSNFSIQSIIFPHQNSKYETGFERMENDHFNYNSPTNIDFFWGTADGEIPCVNKAQIEYFDQKYNVKPQMRSDDLKDGFYAKDTSKE